MFSLACQAALAGGCLRLRALRMRVRCRTVSWSRGVCVSACDIPGALRSRPLVSAVSVGESLMTSGIQFPITETRKRAHFTRAQKVTRQGRHKSAGKGTTSTSLTKWITMWGPSHTPFGGMRWLVDSYSHCGADSAPRHDHTPTGFYRVGVGARTRHMLNNLEGRKRGRRSGAVVRPPALRYNTENWRWADEGTGEACICSESFDRRCGARKARGHISSRERESMLYLWP
eukprot:scaffold11425_cov102-Isochrysis_galbana.AAC.6